MRVALVFLLILTGSDGLTQRASVFPDEAVIIARIRYVYALKQAVDRTCWERFDDSRYEVPLIYYSDTASYVANPTGKFLRIVPASQVFQDEKIRIYRTGQRLDSIPFHMATGFETDHEDSAAVYNYNEPFMACSGYEQTQRRVPDVLSTEQWATMVMHEYFHGFQYRHPAVFALTRNFLYVSSDSLKQIYRGNTWFKRGIDRENAVLLAALAAPTLQGTRLDVDSFLALRDARREEVRRRLGFDITPFETYYELMEGTARYAEFGLYRLFEKMPRDTAMAAIDTAYRDYAYFRDFRIANEPWLYRTEKTSYVYATGFNMARVLDKLGIPFRKTVFDRELSLEAFLRKAR